MSFLLPIVIAAISIVIGLKLTVMGASLLGASLIAFGIAIPLLAVTVRNFNDEMAGA